MGKLIDLTGQRFGRLVVEKLDHIVSKATHNQYYWLCKCDCGNTKSILGQSLNRGATLSCGCFQKEKIRERSKTHGLSKSRLYIIRSNMIQRCYNSRSTYYKNYGGRNITVCDEWKNNPTSFLEWAFSTGYADDLTIERIDNNGNYEPGNCRWATNEEQGGNTRRARLITFKGETRSIAQWARHLKIKKSILIDRLNKLGWSEEEALTTPPLPINFKRDKNKKHLAINCK